MQDIWTISRHLQINVRDQGFTKVPIVKSDFKLFSTVVKCFHIFFFFFFFPLPILLRESFLVDACKILLLFQIDFFTWILLKRIKSDQMGLCVSLKCMFHQSQDGFSLF